MSDFVVELAAGPSAVAAEWDSLAERVAAPPWLRPGWVAAHARAFADTPPEVLVARRAGAPAAVLALRRRHGAVRSPTNWHTPQFGVVAQDREARGALLEDLLRRRPRSVAMHLLDAGSGDVEAWVAAAGAAGYDVATRVELRSPYLATNGALDDHLRERPESRKMLSELRRRRRRLEREGPVAVRIERGAGRLDELLDVAWRLEGSGWKAERGTAVASQSRTRGFYDEIARWAAARGTLRLAFLDVGERPVAVDFLLLEHRRLYVLKRGYDPAYRSHGPGKILLHELIADAFAGPVDSVELLGAADPFKLEWTSSVRERVLVQAFSRSPAGRLERLAYRRGRPLALRALSAARRARGYASRRQASSAS